MERDGCLVVKNEDIVICCINLVYGITPVAGRQGRMMDYCMDVDVQMGIDRHNVVSLPGFSILTDFSRF